MQTPQQGQPKKTESLEIHISQGNTPVKNGSGIGASQECRRIRLIFRELRLALCAEKILSKPFLHFARLMHRVAGHRDEAVLLVVVRLVEELGENMRVAQFLRLPAQLTNSRCHLKRVV